MRLQVLIVVIALRRAIAESTVNKKDLFPTITNNVEYSENQACIDQNKMYREHFENFTIWAHEMWEASAKYSAGVLKGSIYQMGDWNECVTIKGPYETQYCLATISANVPQPDSSRTIFPFHYSPLDKVLNKIYKIENKAHQSLDTVHLGVCIPASCSAKDLEHSLNEYLINAENPLLEMNVTYDAKVSEASCQTQTEHDYFDSLDIAFCSICLLIVLLIFLSTLYDFSTQVEKYKFDEKPYEKSRSQKLCLAFSLRKNILDLSKADESNPTLSVLYGMRTFSIFMIITDHRFGTYSAGPVSNLDYVEEQFSSKFAAYIFHGDLFVDTFFVLSGLLVTYGLLVHFDKKFINPLFIILMRYIRLTPLYAFVILYYASVFNHMGSGPLWKLIIEPEAKDCRANWWLNLLYINNYVKDNNMCMIQTWYLPCDFHYFILAIIVAMILNKKRNIGLGVLVAFFILSVAIPFAITVIYLRPGLTLFYPSVLRAPKKDYDFRLTYTKSHTRASPYVIGMLAGYIFYKLKDTSKHLSKISSHILTIVSILILLTTLVTGTIFYEEQHEYNAIESGLYAALHRVAWAVGTVGLIFTASYGHARILKSALSWSAWIPLSKLVYGAYLIHMVFQFRALARGSVPKYFNYFDLVSLALSDIVLSFIFALFLYLGIEAPFKTIFKELLTPRRPKNKLAPDPATVIENNINHQHNDSQL